MANFLNGFLNNIGQGAGNPKGNLGDFAHASRLYVDSAFALAPKTKYLYHVVFTISPIAQRKLPQLSQRHKNEINLLVKSVDLPKYSINTVTKNMYNRKKNLQTNIEYDPVNITFHDDNLGVTTLLMEAYYKYYYKDSEQGNQGFQSRNTYGPDSSHKYRYGLDNDTLVPFFENIQIFQLSRHEYTAFTLVNPLVTGFQHDTMDQADAQGTAQNQMTVAYEAVQYSRGAIGQDSPAGFGADHYDQTPSPLSLAGGGTVSLLGVGGIADGINRIASGEANILETINTFTNVKQLSAEGLRQEGISAITGGLAQFAKTNVSGLPNTNIPKSQNGTANKTPTSGGTVNQSSSNYSAKVAQAKANNVGEG
jgi:hypothetical protein